MQKSISGATFRKMVLNGAKLLDENKAHVNELNVFPVPDGDTGTNMSLTIQSAVKELSTCSNNGFPDVCDCVSKGALKGARGNSGVISSQIFRGICSVLKDTKDSFDTKTFARAMEAVAPAPLRTRLKISRPKLSVPIQWAGDGVVEALCHRRLPVWAVQWHPERLGNREPGRRLMAAFLGLV